MGLSRVPRESLSLTEPLKKPVQVPAQTFARVGGCLCVWGCLSSGRRRLPAVREGERLPTGGCRREERSRPEARNGPGDGTSGGARPPPAISNQTASALLIGSPRGARDRPFTSRGLTRAFSKNNPFPRLQRWGRLFSFRQAGVSEA